MAVYDIEEQEQIEDLKAWWAQYGKYVSAAITTLAVVVIGVQGWRWYQQTQAREASVLYQAVSQAAHANDAAKAKEPATQLLDRFARTAYAPRGALLYAKLLYDAGDKAGAKTELQWVIDRASEDELKSIARYRIAQVQLDDKQYDEALKTLAAAGKNADARDAYQSALAKLDAKSGYRGYVQAKLDALGGPLVASTQASPAPAAPPAAPGK